MEEYTLTNGQELLRLGITLAAVVLAFIIGFGGRDNNDKNTPSCRKRYDLN